MVRPIYTHELADPDFSWLLTTFKENHPNYISVEGSGLPLVLINIENTESHETEGKPSINEEPEAETASNK